MAEGKADTAMYGRQLPPDQAEVKRRCVYGRRCVGGGRHALRLAAPVVRGSRVLSPLSRRSFFPLTGVQWCTARATTWK